ncbi:uncharacterized protein LOC134469365 [Engraulis encrasicolus]|uniref:uncharacterized protein LOC134469365 n=1 Tax=Engraulis encrasicolus TaxID=184585 RepID=UPI002FD07C51
MGSGAGLRVLILCATVWNACCFPTKASTGQQQPASGGQSPVFDPRYITLLQQYYHSLAPAATSADVPQAPAAQSSQNAPQMTSPVTVKGSSMPQTSSGSQEPQMVAKLPQPAKGQLESSAPVYGAPQSSPVDESLPAAFAEALVLEEPRFDDSPPFPPVPPAPKQYVPGTVIRNMATNEFGLDMHEFHDSGDLLRGPPRVPLAAETATSPVIEPIGEDLELDDQFFHMFITGQLPPGTVTHTSSSYERGRNGWGTIGYERIPPSRPASRTPVAPSNSKTAPMKSLAKKS